MVFNRGMTAAPQRFVLFRAAEGEWAMSASGVAEVLPTAPMQRPAGSPAVLAGFLNLGGRPLPVVRLDALFGAEAGGADDLYHHVLRLTSSEAGGELGLLVERVTDVDAKAEGVAPLEPDQSVNGALVGNLVIGERLVPLLDRGRLLLVEEQRRIDDLAAAARARLEQLDQAGA